MDTVADATEPTADGLLVLGSTLFGARSFSGAFKVDSDRLLDSDIWVVPAEQGK